VSQIIWLAMLIYALLGGRDFANNSACWHDLVVGAEHPYICTFEVQGHTYEIAVNGDATNEQ